MGSAFGEDQRISLSSDVCAACHGEPLRHARFQQWQLSAHANYELAIDEGDSDNCSRCHTANGFLAWTADGNPDADVVVDWTLDEVHPQTCVACHDPHAVGSTTGINTDAEPRITQNTPLLLSGFYAFGVGKGAICMTCHNARRGLRNDFNYEATDTASAARAPHGSAQTDIVMGQNAFLVTVGSRGVHSWVENTCVGCHMEATPPPDLLAYNLGGTNHTFFARDDICGECHGFDGAAGVQSAFDANLDALQALQEEAILQLMADITAAGDRIDLNGDYLLTDVDDILELEFGETSRGRQAISVVFTWGTEGPYRISDIDVLDGSLVSKGNLYENGPDVIVKAGWNWHLVNYDGSRGVHNPDFAFNALDNAIAALLLLAAGP
jgi:mono/diheme cytochrome c family protein